MHLWSDKVLSYLSTSVYIYKYQKCRHMSIGSAMTPAVGGLAIDKHRAPMLTAPAKHFLVCIKMTGKTLRMPGKRFSKLIRFIAS